MCVAPFLSHPCQSGGSENVFENRLSLSTSQVLLQDDAFFPLLVRAAWLSALAFVIQLCNLVPINKVVDAEV